MKKRFFSTLGQNKMSTDIKHKKHQQTTYLWQKGNGKTPNELTIASWNVNGIRSVIKKNTLQDYIIKYQHDLLCLNETKIDHQAFQKQHKSIKQSLQLDNFNYFDYWNFCKVSSGYSGLSIFSKYKPISIIQDIPKEQNHSLEGRSLALQFQKFFIINCYKPNSGSQLQRLSYRVNEYDKKFKKFIKQMQQKYQKPIIVVGDLNVAHHQIDLTNPQKNRKNPGFTNQQRISFSQFLKETNLIDSWRFLNPYKKKYTWWSYRMNARAKNIGWRIDYILTQANIQILDAQIRNQVMGSDHCPIQAKIKLK